jgi:hypothetical protein
LSCICNVKYYLNISSCNLCNFNISGCDTCTTSGIPITVSCTNCMNTYLKSGQVCTSCGILKSGCNGCSGGTCSSCDTTLGYNPTYDTINNKCNCNSTYY